MKRIISLILLLVFLYNTIGNYVVFKILQSQIISEVKKEIEDSISDDQLEIISIPVHKINSLVLWTRNGKEFIYNNKMFDVVKKKEQDGKIIFYCLNDEKEEKLFANLDQHINKNNNQSRRLKNILSSKITNYYVEKYNSFKPSIDSESLKFACLEAYKSIYKEIQSPPPKLS